MALIANKCHLLFLKLKYLIFPDFIEKCLFISTINVSLHRQKVNRLF